MKPDLKVTVGAVAGSVATLIAILLRQVWHYDVSAEGALAVNTVVLFLLQWVTPNSPPSNGTPSA